MMALRTILIPVAAIFIFGAIILSRIFVPPAEQVSVEVASTTGTLYKKESAAVPTPKSELKATTTFPATSSPEDAEKRVLPSKILAPLSKIKEIPPVLVQKPPETRIATATEPQADVMPFAEKLLPVVDEEELMRAVVRIRCGRVYGSGFVITPSGLVLTAAHIIMGAIGSKIPTCDIIFPRKHTNFGYYSEAHYRVGTILDAGRVERFYKEQGMDVAAFQTAFLDSDPVFQRAFPYIKYPLCGSDTLQDKVLLFGYAANIGTSPTSLGSVLSRFEGSVIQYGDIIGISKEPSQIYKGGHDYFPEYSYSLNAGVLHPTAVIASTNNFSGASGGLVFDSSQNCIVGVNSVVATVTGDPRIFGLIVNPNFSAIKSWLDTLFSR